MVTEPILDEICARTAQKVTILITTPTGTPPTDLPNNPLLLQPAGK